MGHYKHGVHFAAAEAPRQQFSCMLSCFKSHDDFNVTLEARSLCQSDSAPKHSSNGHSTKPPTSAFCQLLTAREKFG